MRLAAIICFKEAVIDRKVSILNANGASLPSGVVFKGARRKVSLGVVSKVDRTAKSELDMQKSMQKVDEQC